MIAASLPPSRRAPRADSGEALFAALAGTIRLLRWLLFGLVALYLCSGLTRVAPHEDAVIYRLGRLRPEVHGPGLLFALPAPIDRVVKVSTRTQHELFLNAWSPDENAMSLATANAQALTPGGGTTNAATLAVLGPPPGATTIPSGKGLHPVFDGYTLTGDVNVVQARFTVRYRIADPRAYELAATPPAVEGAIESAVFAAATRLLAQTRIDDALGAGLDRLRRDLREVAQPRLDALHLGIELVAIEVNALNPPQATVAAFADVTSAQVEARTALEQARTYRAQTLPKAEGDAYRLRQQAEADGRQLVARATAETSSFRALLAEHQLAPALVEYRLRAETLEQVLPRMKSKTVLPAGGADFNLWLREK